MPALTHIESGDADRCAAALPGTRSASQGMRSRVRLPNHLASRVAPASLLVVLPPPRDMADKAEENLAAARLLSSRLLDHVLGGERRDG